MGAKETGGKATGARETGGKVTGRKVTGAKETRLNETGAKVTKASGVKAIGAQHSQEMGEKGNMLMGEREMDNMLPDVTTGEESDPRTTLE